MKAHVETRQSRNSNIELLRIIAMFLIVFGHASMWSGIDVDAMPLGWNRYFLRITHVGDVGANVFALISGYCMSKANFTWKKVGMLWGQVLFYSLGLTLIFRVIGVSLDGYTIIDSFMPITRKTYWFVSVYLIMLVLSPYINQLVLWLDSKKMLSLLVILSACWIVAPTFLHASTGGFLLEHMLLMYLWGAYLRRRAEDGKCLCKGVGVFCMLASALIMLASVYWIDMPEYDVSYIPYSMFDARAIPAVVMAIGMLLVAVNGRLYVNRWVNQLASCTLGIYLIHEHPMMREWLWKQIFPLKEYVSDSVFCLICITKAVGVFVLCMLVEMLRKKLTQKIFYGLCHGHYIRYQ